MFPSNLNVSLDFVSGNIEILGKQNSLFPSGPVIKCLLLHEKKLISCCCGIKVSSFPYFFSFHTLPLIPCRCHFRCTNFFRHSCLHNFALHEFFGGKMEKFTLFQLFLMLRPKCQVDKGHFSNPTCHFPWNRYQVSLPSIRQVRLQLFSDNILASK